MKWNVARARQRLGDLLRAAASEPQEICNRDRTVAGVVDADTLREVLSARKLKEQGSIEESFAQYRALAAREKYRLKLSHRKDRPNPFAKDWRGSSR